MPPPPPPPPPDRRDYLYREGRRHDGGDPLSPPAPTPPRWRDSPYHPPPPPPPPLRDHARPSPRRTASSASESYYRQGGAAYDRSYPDDPTLGYTPSRSDRYWLEDDGAGYKGFGRYGGSGGRRDGRDTRGSYRRSPFRSEFSRNHQEQPPPPPRRSPLRSVAVPICYDPPGNRADKGERDNLPRMTPWRRRESRSEASGAAGGGPASAGLATRPAASEKEVSAQPSAVAASHGAEDEAPRKKPRLGWGQGLAKYEKQKVHVPAAPAEADTDGSPVHAEQKTTIPVLAPEPEPCASPVALPSPAPPCSSSAPEDTSCEKTTNTVTNAVQDIYGADDRAGDNEFPIKLDQLGDNPIDALANMLTELLQQHESCSGELKGPSSTSKLLLLKESISKEIEKIELEIDSLEGDLKSVNTETGTALEVSPTGVTDAEDLSPSSGTTKVPCSVAICETSHVKKPGELIPCPEVPLLQDAHAKGAEMMEIEITPVHNAKTVSSEESAACHGVAEGQANEPADVGPQKPSEGAGPQVDADNERLEASSFHVSTDSMKADGGGDEPQMQCSYKDHGYNLSGSVTSNNNDIAKVANELVFKPLPAHSPRLDILAASNLVRQRKNDSIFRERLAIHKSRLKFKEQTLTFKFKVLRHLWKEDLRLLSARKHRSKSHKRIDQSNRTSQIGSQRQRSSSRSRLATLAGHLSTSPTPEMSDVASKIFSEFQIKRCRNYLKMPALILDGKEKECSKFVSKNGLVEDPVAVEKERIMINPWTQEEKEIFMEMLAKYGKDFSKISSFLTHKTIADCVEFYYKCHKSDSFGEVKKLLDLRQQQQPASNYLGAKSGMKWNPEANAASLDMLGVASAVAAHGLEYANRTEKISAKSLIRTAYGSNVFFPKKPSDRECVDNVSLLEKESVAADVLAGICGTLSPEGMGSCITSSADPGQKISITRMDRTIAPEIDRSNDEEDNLSDQECEVDPVDWNEDEKSLFIEAMNNFGKDFAQISSCVKSKSYEQCKVFFSKARKSLGLDLIHQGAADVSMPTSDTNGGRSDTDEACAGEMDSAICSLKSCSKVEMDVCPATEVASQGPNSEFICKQPENDISNGCDVIDVKIEEGENKADKVSNIVEHRETNSAACGPIDINCPEKPEKLEGIDNIVDQMNLHTNIASSSSTEQATAVHSEVRCTLQSSEVLQTNKAPERTAAEVFQVRECSHHALDDPPPKPANTTCSAAGSGIKDKIVHLPNMTGASSISPAFTSSIQHPLPGDIPPSKPKPHVTPLTPKDLMPVQFSSLLPDPTSIRFEGIASITTPNFEDKGNIVINPLGAKENMYPAFEDQSVNQHDKLFRNIDGYSNHHLTTELPIFSERIANGTVSTSQPDRFSLTKFQNDRSSSLGLPNTTDGIQWSRKNEDVREGLLRPCSRNTSSESDEQLKRPGDVKLFGQILSHQSSLHNSGSSCNGSQSKPLSSKIDVSSMRLPSNSRERVACSKPALTSHLGLEERAVRSYGHLDGSTTQPDPVLLVAKCQRSLAGVPFYSAKNGTLGMFSEYQQPVMQLHQSDPKRLERLSDPHKKNGIEFVSGFQQPAKGSRFGGAGILVGGVSDPVTALKAQYGPGSKIMSSDVDPWKDIGSR